MQRLVAQAVSKQIKKYGTKGSTKHRLGIALWVVRAAYCMYCNMLGEGE
jgi:hypothetical protein